ncbi:pyridoxamine 5'-phosphate oxidase [Sphingorhabdus lutea]|uniref:Pyridoxine/pyridoxamine 5'-phosphate oxidase n=1 Tax=Sphingorhabdus lutea TaxID=1913578 RepID=A0A1L3JFA2_9SPHN|nr:pyridoxamine 5'-phosphate oxidase [Sphingorhabdus lutea]APG63821.1 pyridoxamine 5'-phosphate oxidase [Sphingorhabdus lutea]
MQDKNPYDIFDQWLNLAKENEPNDYNAMALATSTADGRPSCRMVLLKGHGPKAQGIAHQGGFIFYTNLQSRKGGEIAVNPHASLLFHWKSLRRQIRIEGKLERVSEATADAYFATRSRPSQIGACASDQSRPLDDRATFESRYKAIETKYEGQDIPRPKHWSGHIVIPHHIEFWQDREFRLHERWVFARDEHGGWGSQMLYP